VRVKKTVKYPKTSAAPLEVNEAALAFQTETGPMVRTQIYLSKGEYDFVQAEASRRHEPMAAVIRAFIDEKMEIPEDAWTNNPMLEPTPHDPNWVGHEDGGINHDHYVSGCPKKWIKVNGKYIEAPPLPEDYYSNRQSHEAYDQKIREMDETR